MDHNVSFPDVARIKMHFRKNKTRYQFFGLGMIAGITVVIMRGRYEALAYGGAYGPQTADNLVTMRPLSFMSNRMQNTVKIFANHTGRPGYLIHSKDYDLYFSSQRETAHMFGISEGVLSKHLNGILPDAKGYQFERVHLAA